MAFGEVATGGGSGPSHPDPTPSGSGDCCILVNSVEADLSVETLHAMPITNGARKYHIYGTVTAKAEKKCIPKNPVYNPYEDATPAEQGPNFTCGDIVIPLTCDDGQWPAPTPESPTVYEHLSRPKPTNTVPFGFDFDCNPMPGLPVPPSLKLCAVEWETCGEPCPEDPTNCYCNIIQETTVDFEIEFLNVIGDVAGLVRAVRRLLPGDAQDVADFINDIGGCAARFMEKMIEGMPKGVCGKKVNCSCEKEGESRDFGKPNKKPKYDPLPFDRKLVPSWVGVPEQGGSSSQPCDCDAF